MQPGEEFLCHGNGSSDEILFDIDIIDLFDTGESRNVSLNSFWQVK
jgi:hypothetical protein